ncbi:glycerol-3-phosphate dehydrogenase [Dispira simplex]|nr:glycerol-3-phosphate dehydrogenase [Dispira simplex]
MSLQSQSLGSEKVAIIGSGNCHEFNTHMWVYEEYVNNHPLTYWINNHHENVKYLPGVHLPHNVVAESNLIKAVEGATILVFVLPHQFIRRTCEELKGHVSSECKAISLVKGLDMDGGSGLNLISKIIADKLGVDVSVLSGANIANEVGQEKFCETTIGYRIHRNGQLFYELFNTPYFRVTIVNDPSGVELCGALKNVVAIGAGMVDGLDLGDNTKAAIIRVGLVEMMKFAELYDPTVQDATFFESCGIADVITTCAGGRNRRLGEAFVRTGKSFDELEKELLNGQKLQGASTCEKLYQYLKDRGLVHKFPLFSSIYRICFENLAPENITRFHLTRVTKL